MIGENGELAGKIALITGSSRGIGSACAKVMAREGADVVVNYRESKAEAERVAAEIHGLGRQALVIQADVSDPQQLRKMVEQAVDTWGRIDILVNNVGQHSTRQYSIEEMTLEDWHASLDVNLTSQLLCVQAVVPGMVQRGWGRIVNIGSVVAQRGSGSGDVYYTAAKAGVHGLTLAVFRPLAPKGITVNTASPGVIDTPMTRLVLSEQEIQTRVKGIPVGRIGTAEEVAELVSFLASERASFVTGQLIGVNGGQYV
jgi:3-oxoacyl-[acyl-carrier protein] reductase